jgi:hypothetical protein
VLNPSSSAISCHVLQQARNRKASTARARESLRGITGAM